MPKILRSNLGYKLIAILLALILWFYITEESNPFQDHVVDVPLETRALQLGMMVSDKPDTVQVRLQGRQSIVSRVNARDIIAFVDLSKGRIGLNTLTVQVVLPPGAQLVSINPSPVVVSLDAITETQFALSVDVQDLPANGYLALKPESQPAQVVIAGPNDVIERIGQVYVEARLESRTTNFEAVLPVKVKDRWGNNIGNWLKIDPAAVRVFIPVVVDLPQKIVPVNVVITGKPAPGYRVNRVVVEPEQVNVFAPSTVLNSLKAVETVPIDIDGAKEDISRQVELNLPPEAGSGGLKTVQVVIQVTVEGSR
ncbi:MAG: CdaR family protein [Bacillota bacterium]